MPEKYNSEDIIRAYEQVNKKQYYKYQCDEIREILGIDITDEAINGYLRRNNIKTTKLPDLMNMIAEEYFELPDDMSHKEKAEYLKKEYRIGWKKPSDAVRNLLISKGLLTKRNYVNMRKPTYFTQWKNSYPEGHPHTDKTYFKESVLKLMDNGLDISEAIIKVLDEIGLDIIDCKSMIDDELREMMTEYADENRLLKKEFSKKY